MTDFAFTPPPDSVSDQTRADGYGKLGRAFKVNQYLGGQVQKIEAGAAMNIDQAVRRNTSND